MWPPRAVHSLELPNLAARGAHFEPTVWIPRVESRAEKFPQYRQYGPLTPPINRISVEDLGGKEFGSKVSQKTSIFAQFLQISSFTSNAGRQLQPPPPGLLIFFFPSAASNKGQLPLLQSQTGAALSLSSLSLPAAPALSPLPLINTKPAADLHLSFSFTAASQPPATPPASSSAATASTGASLRLPASSPGQQQSSIPAAAATPGEEQ